MKLFCFYIAILFFAGATVHSQVPGLQDTITINEVVISPVRQNSSELVYKRSEIDSSVLISAGQFTVAEILSWHSPVFIKNYGPGGTATPSFRGTGAGNSNVTWNGIKVDHPMVGQADLSLLPAAIVDELHIYYGGASMENSSGATGGVIAIENKPAWENRTILTFNSSAGSFDRFSGQGAVRTGSEQFQSVTRAYAYSSRNDFSYINRVYSTEPFSAKRGHNSGTHQGFMQELYYRKSANILSFRFWYQASSRNIPASLLVYPDNNGGHQSDQHSRFMTNYEFSRNGNKFFVTGAFMHAKLDYTNSVSSIESRNMSDIFVLKSGADINTSEHTILNLLLDEEFCIVNSNNYDGFSQRNIAGVSANLASKNTGMLGGNLLFRQILYNNKLLIPDFSGGLFLKTGTKNYFLRGNFSRSSKIPSMNDLYWLPGGNPELQNEHSYISELSYEMNDEIGKYLKFSGDITFFHNDIKNMIRWKPGSTSIWSAVNIGTARSYGLESSLKALMQSDRINITVTAGYSYTRAYDKEDPDHRQLVYIPVNNLNGTLSLKYGRINASWRSVMNGRRYTEADNSKYLPPFFISSITAGIMHQPAWGSLEVAFDIENLFNHEYQTMAYYPLPGRSYNIRFTTRIINKRK